MFRVFRVQEFRVAGFYMWISKVKTAIMKSLEQQHSQMTFEEEPGRGKEFIPSSRP